MKHGETKAKSISKPKDFSGTLKRFIKYLFKRKSQLIVIVITAVLSVVFSILAPKIIGNATTEIFQGAMGKVNGGSGVNFSKVFKILASLAIMYLISAIFNYIQQYLMADVAQKTVYEMRQDINEKLNKLPLRYYDSNTYGEVLSRITNDIDNISVTLQQTVTQLITASVTIVGIVIMMLSISPKLTLISILVLPISILFLKPILTRSQKLFASQQKHIGELNGHIEEMYGGHKVVKAFGHEEKSIDEFKVINEMLYEQGWKAQFFSGITMPLLTFLNNIVYVLIAVLGGIMVTKGKINIGDVQAFIQYSMQFTQPIAQTANIANVLQSTVASAERVFQLLDEDEIIPDNTVTVSTDKAKGSVEFKHVKFGYKEEQVLIKDMNIKVQPGEMVAIVGPTGAGKTTLINLLMRFYEINEGQILIDGIDIRDMTRSDLRKIFGMVLQDTWLFNGTIKDNIAYGKEEATIEEVVEAAKLANVHKFIMSLHEGYDTVINEEGSNISQGQKQLLTIARAILANPTILILDEATSSVDTRTELQIQNAMNKLMEGRTSFVIAHRLSTIKDADMILVMKSGDVIEKGTHEELLEKGGVYAELYNSQFAQQGAS